MEYHTDNNAMFAPLLKHLEGATKEERTNVMGSYMYMGHTSVCYYYKHRDTRDYVYLSENGQIVDGTLDKRDWRFER